ncbi:MAG: helix-turn-helix transcriptional regulator [Alphaproteobacteria bacterium]
MITGRQIRAARSLLEWKAEDLAREAGLTRVTVSKIEADTVQPHEKTIASITNAFDRHGVEFLDDEGVRMRRNQVRVFSGKAGYRQFLDHIYETLKDGGRIRQFNSSDGKTLSYAQDYATEHMERMSKLPNLDARVLILDGDYNFSASYCEYRWLDKTTKILIPYYVYNDYIAQAVHRSDHNVEVVSIHSKPLAERYVEQFESFWENASIPDDKGKI